MADEDSEDFVEIARVNGKTCKFEASDLEDGEKYFFRIKAFNSSGTSGGSAELDKAVVASKLGKIPLW